MPPTPSDILEEISSALASHDPDGDSGDLVEELHCIMEQYHPEPMSTPTPEQINNLVTFTRKFDGEWAVRDVHGPVRGNVYRHIEGSVYGNINGAIHGGVEGSVGGYVRGNVCAGVGGTISGHKFYFIFTDEDHRRMALVEESDANQSARVVSATQEFWRSRLSRLEKEIQYCHQRLTPTP